MEESLNFIEIGLNISYLKAKMIRLNRTTEYGLIALRHMNRKQDSHPDEWTSAREIADAYGLPFEITAKTLQKLKDSGLIQSTHGARGGYHLQRALKEISLAEFLELMEGPQSVVMCAGSKEDHSEECGYNSRCEIKQVMGQLNFRVFNFLSGIPLADLAEGSLTPVSIQK